MILHERVWDCLPVARFKGKAKALPYGGHKHLRKACFLYFPASSAVKKGRGSRRKKKRGDRFSPSPRFIKGYQLWLPLKVHCLRKDFVGGGDDLGVELETPLRGNQRGQFRSHVHVGTFEEAAGNGAGAIVRRLSATNYHPVLKQKSRHRKTDYHRTRQPL